MKGFYHIILFFALAVFGVPANAQSDIEMTDSTSTEWDGDFGGGGIVPEKPDEPVKSMTLSPTSITLEGGKSARLSVTFNARAKDKTVLWTSEDPAIATVSSNGLVFALKRGTTTVTATSVYDNTFRCTCQVTVTSDYVAPSIGWLLKKGTEEAWQMKYIFYPDVNEYQEPGKDSRGHTWHDLGYDDSKWQTLTGPMSSDNDGNYKWDGDDNAFCLRRQFNLPNIALGRYVMYVKNDDDVKVWINDRQVVEYNDWSGGNYLQYEIPASVFVSGTNQMAIYIHQGFGGAYLDYGLWFESQTPVQSISLTPRQLTLAGGERAYITATVMPEDAANKRLSWTVANPTIASVNSDGRVRALKKGTTLVHATARDGSGVSASCVVTVTSDVVQAFALPDVPFEFFYMAKNYDSDTQSIPNHQDATLSDYSLQLTENLPELCENGQALRITDRCEGYIDRWEKGSTESGAYFYRQGQDCMTIVAKVAPWLNTGNASDFVTNREDGHNYMWRIGDNNMSFLHTDVGYQQDRSLPLTSEEPQVLAVRVDGVNDYILLQNLTSGDSRQVNGVQWGWEDNVFKLFYNDDNEYWLGDFYWVYYSFELLTDEDLEQLLEYRDDITTDITQMTGSSARIFTPCQLYDLSGRTLHGKEPLHKGLYIRNGQKIVVR